ncbi:nitronate monooxygenase [Flavobacteriaceae bacterium]|nr:nitronate monooxygenase [Flavobacteriaceae bacterium]
MFNKLKELVLSGKELLPIIEGGKGIGITTGVTAGHFAKAGAVGTFSGVNADYYDENGNLVPVVYNGKTRLERHKELIDYGINGGVSQARIAHDISGGAGAIHMNVLWEMGGAEEILHGVLSKTKGLIHGVTCGAGMPYRLSEIAKQYNVFYYPIVSSMRAFRALWKRSYSKCQDLLGAIVYEDPWLAGGHNGLSNSEKHDMPQDPYPRVAEIRKFMNSVGLNHVPIVMAGGVWRLDEWAHWLDNDEIGPISFQFGTRPVVTKEYPVSDAWKLKLLNLKEGDVYLNRFSPTGFYSSAVENDFIKGLKNIEDSQVSYSAAINDEFSIAVDFGKRGRKIYIKSSDQQKVQNMQKQGLTELLKTPDETVIFVSDSKAKQINKDQIDCMGCLSQCRFSNWSQDATLKNTTGKKPDPRSFCIQKTLQDIRYNSDINDNLMFSGHNAYRFAIDSLYDNNHIPTIAELIEQISLGK